MTTVIKLEPNNKGEKDRLFVKEFMPYNDALYNFAYSITHDEDESNDLVQETLLKAYKYFDNYEMGTKAKSWLFKILHNLYINEYRKKSKMPFRLDYEDYLANEDRFDDRTYVVKQNMGDELVNAMNHLPPQYRTLIILRDVEGYSYEELSNIFDIPLGTLKVKLHKSRNKFKQLLEKQGFSYRKSA